MKKRNKYDKVRRIFRTLKTGILFYGGEFDETITKVENNKMTISYKTKVSFRSNNGNNIDWFIKDKIVEK